MTFDQPGLRQRIGKESRRISSQHRQLDTLWQLLVDRLDAGELEEGRLAFTRFRDALDAHFSLEDGFYFPAVHGMHPHLTEKLESLSREHEVMKRELQRIEGLLENGCAAELDAFVTKLAAHEGREESLLAELKPKPVGEA